MKKGMYSRAFCYGLANARSSVSRCLRGRLISHCFRAADINRSFIKFLGFVLSVVFAQSSFAALTPGVIPGSFSVSETGAATYSIPIAVPPGTAGMEPKLSLNYSSQGGNGIAGVGWSLGGLSAITRCPQTIVQDGATRGVQLDANDRFCLDGQRLIVINGATYGAPGAEYRTEIESFSKIVSYGGTAGDPQYFKVLTKAGQIIEFGNMADSRVEAQGKALATAWAVNKISDTAGNYIAFTYFEDDVNGEHRIERIDYTGNDAAGVNPYNAMEFQYEARPDPSTGYLAGSLKQEAQRLANIQTKAGTALVADYQLDYEIGTATGRSRLVSLTQCAADGNCLAPTTFGWQESEALSFDSSAIEQSLVMGTMADIWFSLGDLNGDGHIDAAAIKLNPYTFYSSLGSDSGFNTTTTRAGTGAFNETSDLGRFYLADYDGDGRSDPALCVSVKEYWGGGFYVDRAYKIAWHAGDAGQVDPAAGSGGDIYLGDPGANARIAMYQWCMPAELNGDGRADTLWYAGAYQQRFLFGLSNGDGSNYEELSSEQSGSLTFYYRWPSHRLGAPSLNTLSKSTYTSWFYPVDVNGDGRTDAARIDATSGVLNLWTTNSDGKSYTTLPTVPLVAGSAPQNRWYVMADINGDGLADAVLHDPANGKLSAWIAKGNGGFNAQVDTPTFDTGGLPTDTWLMVSDVNHDGRADVVKYKPATGAFIYALSLGNGAFDIAQQINIGVGKNPGEGWFEIADINGDGKADVVRYNPATGMLAVNFALGAVPDRLMAITDGLGDTRSIAYKPLTDPSVYTKGSGAVYPEQDMQAAMYVVSETAADDGIGGQFRINYRYNGARTHLTGRGFLGFATLEQTDQQTGIVTRTSYRQDFPYIGMPTLVTKTSSGGVELNRVENSHAVKAIPGGGQFPYIAYSKEQSKDLNAAALPTTETWNETFDDWGNATKITTQTSDGFLKQTVNTYTNDTTNWLLGRLTRASVSNSLNGGTPQTRVSAFEYDSSTGLLTKEIIEPDAANVQFRLDTTYTHDAFGNRKTATVSSPATGTAVIATRSTTTTYDARGQFPVTLANALGHTENKTYDPRFGAVKTLTGPNALTTTWEYDGFGRKTRETRADGTYTVWTYERCDVACPGAGVYRIFTQVYGSDASQAAPTSAAYFDRLNRAVRQASQGFDGRWIYTDTDYDNQGRVKRSSRPYYALDTAYWTTPTYDDLGRTVRIDNPDGSWSTMSYNGLTTVATNAKSQTTTTLKNSQGQTVSVTDALGKTTTYAYDPFGNLVQVINPNNTVETYNFYDLRGRKTYGYSVDMGWWQYQYSALGDLVQQTDAKSQLTSFKYDLLGRMTQRIEPGLTSDWVWDSASYGKGKLQSAQTSLGYIRSHYYDDIGRPFLTLSNMGANSPFLWSSASFDAAGRVSEQHYPSGLSLRHTYNALGYAVELRNVSGNALYWKRDTQDAEGRITKETYGNGVVVDHNYNALNGRLVTRQDVTAANQWIQYHYYDYDTLGNVQGHWNSGTGIGEAMIYDSLNRLTQIDRSVGETVTETVAYDALGNITSKTGVGAYTYADPNGKIHAATGAGGNTYSYDANGNLIGGGGRIIGWTAWNMPGGIIQGGQSSTWLYGPEHERYKLATNGRTTWYLNPSVHQGKHYEQTQYSSGTVEHRTTLYGGGRPIGEVLMLSSNGVNTTQTRYFHSDGQGSISAVTDAAGAVITRYKYDPWGKQTVVSGNNAGIAQTRQGHTGHEMLDSGLTHMNGRLYDPVLARFVSADPYVDNPYNLQSLNRYSYVWNNPLGYTDPTGFIPYSDGGSFGGGSIFLSGGSSSGLNFSFGTSSSWGGGSNRNSGKSSVFNFVPSGGGVTQSSIGSSGVFNNYSLAGNGSSLSSYSSGQSLLSGNWGGNGRSSSANAGSDQTYSGMLSGRSTMDGQGRTMSEIWSAQNSSRSFAMGFVPGSGLNDAADAFRNGSYLYGLGMLAMEAPGAKFAKGVGAAGDGAKGGTEIVQRAMSRRELEAIQNSGFLSRGGRPGDHFVSDAVNSSADRARQRLALPGAPQVRATLEVPSNVFSGPSRVAPKYNMPGGGMERTAPGNIDIPARVLDVLQY